MLQRLQDYERLAVEATDGQLGSVDDFLFDDERWTIRYLVASTGSLFGRKVALSPIAANSPDWTEDRLSIRLSMDRIRQSPDLLMAGDIPRTREREYAAYYGYPAYWGGPGLWAWAGAPGALAGTPPPEYRVSNRDDDPASAETYRHRLRSVVDLRGAHLHALDGELGHIEDVIVDGESWNMPYLVVGTSNWIGGKRVLMPTAMALAVDWPARRLHVQVPREHLKEAPAYDGARVLAPAMTVALNAYYRVAAPKVRARAAGASATRVPE
jgi:hypothetical protein